LLFIFFFHFAYFPSCSFFFVPPEIAAHFPTRHQPSDPTFFVIFVPSPEGNWEDKEKEHSILRL